MKTNTNAKDKMKSHFIQAWGRKCTEYDEKCACCIAWKWYEGAGQEYLIELVHQKTIEAQQELVYQIMRGEHGHDEKSIVESLQASLNTEGEK